MKNAAMLLLAAVLGIGMNVQAAETYGFDRITNSSSANPEGQLFMDVSDAGSNQVLFHFYNVGPILSSICDIYFDNGTPGSTLTSIANIEGSDGVLFSIYANPADLPSGNTIDFEATWVLSKQDTLSADSDSGDPGVAENGVNPLDEWVNLTLNLASGKTFGDTITALGDGTLRVGLHVQAIGTDGRSDAFVNGFVNGPPPPVVPAPGAIVLTGIGTMLVGWLRRRKSI